MYSVSMRGKRGYIMSIPASWVRKQKLQPGETMIITQVEGEDCIRVYPTGEYRLDKKQ